MKNQHYFIYYVKDRFVSLGCSCLKEKIKWTYDLCLHACVCVGEGDISLWRLCYFTIWNISLQQRLFDHWKVLQLSFFHSQSHYSAVKKGVVHWLSLALQHWQVYINVAIHFISTLGFYQVSSFMHHGNMKSYHCENKRWSRSLQPHLSQRWSPNNSNWKSNVAPLIRSHTPPLWGSLWLIKCDNSSPKSKQI